MTAHKGFGRGVTYQPPDTRLLSQDTNEPNHWRNPSTYHLVVFLDVLGEGPAGVECVTGCVKQLAALEVSGAAELAIYRARAERGDWSRIALHGFKPRPDSDKSVNMLCATGITPASIQIVEASLLPSDIGAMSVDARFHGRSMGNPVAWHVSFERPQDQQRSDEVSWDGQMCIAVNCGFVAKLARDVVTQVIVSILKVACEHLDVLSGYVHIQHHSHFGHNPWAYGSGSSLDMAHDVAFGLCKSPRRDVVRFVRWGNLLSPALAARFDGKEHWIEEFRLLQDNHVNWAPMVTRLPSGHVFLACARDVLYASPADPGAAPWLAKNMGWLHHRMRLRGMLA